MYNVNTPNLYSTGFMAANIRFTGDDGRYLRSMASIGIVFRSLKNSVRRGFTGTQLVIITPSRLIIGSMLDADHTKLSLICPNISLPCDVWMNTLVAPLRLNFDDTEGASQQSKMVMSLRRCNVLKWQL